MDRRVMVKQYIDMDELSKPWETESKIINPCFQTYFANIDSKIYDKSNIDDIKMYKNLDFIEEIQDVKGKVLKK